MRLRTLPQLLLLALLVAALACAAPAAARTARLTQTSQQGGERLTEMPPVPFTKSTPLVDNGDGVGATFVITLDKSQRFQRMEGFGGAFTEASAVTLFKMNPALQLEALMAYFGPDGNSYTLCRTHIESCDFSVASYTYDNVTDDFDLAHFSIEHDTKTLIPLIQGARAVYELSAVSALTPLRIFASPWSPPPWMKSNGQMDGSDVPGLKADLRYHQAWADMIVKYLRAYREHGIAMWGLTPQNEPLFSPPWEGCRYDGPQERDFVRDFLGPAVKSAFPDTKIILYDHNKDEVFNFVDPILSDPRASQYTDYVGIHWYIDGPDDLKHLDMVHAKYPNVTIIATEACEGPGVVLGSWSRGEHYGFDMIQDMRHHVSAWTDWNLFLDMQGGPNHVRNFVDAPIILDTDKQQIHLQIPYYYMGQISRYVLPGSVRVLTSPEPKMRLSGGRSPRNPGDLLHVAFDFQGMTVLVVMNDNDYEMAFEVRETGASDMLRHTIPAHSIQTFRW